MAPTLARRSHTVPASPIRKLLPLALEAVARGRQVYYLNIGQPDIHTPAPFMEAVRGYDNPVVGYGPSQGLPQYLEAVSDYYARRNIDLATDQIIGTTGGSEALLFSLMAVCNPGEEAIVIEPFYTNYNGFSAAIDVVLRPVPADPADGFRLPGQDRLQEAVNDRTRAIIICSPNNPTGTVLTREELERVADLAERHNLWVLSDEVYREFAYGCDPVSVMQIPRLRDRAVLLDSISKRYAVCGARVGSVACLDKDFLSLVLRLGQSRLCPPTLEQVGATAAYQMDDSYFDGVRAEYLKRRDAMLEGLAQIPGAMCVPPRGAFYVMATLPIADSDHFCSWLLREFDYQGETLMLAPGSGFYATPGKGQSEVRIAYVLEEGRCRRAMEILKVAVERYQTEVEGHL